MFMTTFRSIKIWRNAIRDDLKLCKNDMSADICNDKNIRTYNTSGQTCPSGRSLRVLGVCQLVGHRLVMPLLLRPQLVMHWLVMHVLAKDSPGWPGDVSVTDLATMCACKFTLKITVD